LLQRKSEKIVKINEFRYFSTYERGISEGSKGTEHPLRAFARASFGRTFSSFTPKD
jgi:hypothetical protein